MPTYVYRREDGSTFEVEQKITEDKLETCPDTGQPVTRLISGGSFHLKGSGFYETDYVRKKDKNTGGTDGSEKSESTESKTDSSAGSNGSKENGSSKSKSDSAKSTAKSDS